jgi:hypothetical protein
MTLKMKLLISLLFCASNLLSQTSIKGLIKDNTGAPLPYCSIGYHGKTLGTLSDENGEFELKLNGVTDSDTIKFFAIGFNEYFISVLEAKKQMSLEIKLQEAAVELLEVEVSAKKVAMDYLGTKKFTTNNCSGFVKNEENWKGSETAINANNKVGRDVFLQNFSFYIIQNKYNDSLKFRLMLYEASEKNYPRLKTILRKPIVFKVPPGQVGEFIVDITKYNVVTNKNFFISLECLQNEMEITKFCYAGSPSVTSFVKSAAFARWNRLRGGGADFKMKVTYNK